MMDPNQEYDGPRYYGKFKAFVRENADPERRGRLRCFCPQVMGTIDGSSHWTGWAEPCLPWLGGLNTLDSGPPLTKEQNGGFETGVWLEFEGGIPDFPIWVGTWLPAPTADSPNAQLNLENATGGPPSSIVASPTAGSNVADANPVRPQPDAREVRLMAKRGYDVIIGVEGGGFLVLSMMGVYLDGVNVNANGRLIGSNKSDKVSG